MKEHSTAVNNPEDQRSTTHHDRWDRWSGFLVTFSMGAVVLFFAAVVFGQFVQVAGQQTWGLFSQLVASGSGVTASMSYATAVTLKHAG
jgi:hypothetical protein